MQNTPTDALIMISTLGVELLHYVTDPVERKDIERELEAIRLELERRRRPK